MYRQFAITLVIAVVLSGIVALTLTPALCAMLLKETPHEHAQPASSGGSTAGSTGSPAATSARGGRVLGPAARLAGGVRRDAGAGLRALRRVPTAFIPTEDKGYLRDRDPAARRRLAAAHRRRWSSGWRACLRQGARASEHFAALVGFDLLAQANQTNGATMFVLLKPWDERNKDEHGRRDPWPGQRAAVRDEGRARLRLQLPRDPRPRHDGGPGAQPPGRGRARTSRPSPGQVQSCPGRHEQASGDAGRGDDRSGPTCPRSSSRWIGKPPRRAA